MLDTFESMEKSKRISLAEVYISGAEVLGMREMRWRSMSIWKSILNNEIPGRLDAVPNAEKIAKDWMPQAMLNFDAKEPDNVEKSKAGFVWEKIGKALTLDDVEQCGTNPS